MARRGRATRLTPKQQELAAANLNLARNEAWKYQRRTNIEYSILESAAFEGLCQAASRYDPQLMSDRTGEVVKFSSLAVPYIRGGILHYIRDRTYSMRLTHRMRELWSKGRKFLNKGASDLEVASALGIEITEWQDVKSACSGPPLELKDQATPTEALEPEEPDCLVDFRREAEVVLEGMSPALRRRLERFCRGRSAQVPPLITQELPRHI
jgi:DNA-directed RNA polymerase specialized sigma subunit